VGVEALSESDGIDARRDPPACAGDFYGERKRRDLPRGFAGGRTFLTRPSGSRGFDELVDLPPRLEPVDVAGEGPFMHFAKEFDGFRFVAWFARIFGRDNLLDIDRHDQPICLD
jgi:hypothetical protein